MKRVLWWTGGIIVVLAIGFVVLYVKHQGGGGRGLVNVVTKSAKSAAEQAGIELSNGNCSGKGPGVLSHTAMNPSDFAFIIPYGLMVGGHVTPVDHQYYSPIDYHSPRDAYPVYAMGDANLVAIEHRTEQPQDNQHTRSTETNEYRLIFSQSCTSFYYYDLLTSLTPELTAKVGGKRDVRLSYPVKAGDLIGHIGGQTLDFAVWDTEKPLSGFVVPQHYNGEPWKIYVADPLSYETADLKTLMLSRYPRTDEPLSGKIDWDVDGTLQGTWFEQGTNYLEGDRSNPKGQWVGHLSFAPDLYDPSRWIVSMGDYPIAQDTNTQVSATQFYAKASSPDPSKVTVQNGLTKIELVSESYVKPDGSPWNSLEGFVKGPKVGTNSESQIMAVALVQLTDNRTLKFEVFPGKSAVQVAGFDDHAKTYTR